MIQQRLRARREELGFSRAQLAQACGIDRATVYRIEAGQVQEVGSGTLYRIAGALHCSTDYLLGRVEALCTRELVDGLFAAQQSDLDGFDRAMNDGDHSEMVRLGRRMRVRDRTMLRHARLQLERELTDGIACNRDPSCLRRILSILRKLRPDPVVVECVVERRTGRLRGRRKARQDALDDMAWVGGNSPR